MGTMALDRHVIASPLRHNQKPSSRLMIEGVFRHQVLEECLVEGRIFPCGQRLQNGRP
jgi:hypothetical protein